MVYVGAGEMTVWWQKEPAAGDDLVGYCDFTIPRFCNIDWRGNIVDGEVTMILYQSATPFED